MLAFNKPTTGNLFTYSIVTAIFYLSYVLHFTQSIVSKSAVECVIFFMISTFFVNSNVNNSTMHSKSQKSNLACLVPMHRESPCTKLIHLYNELAS